MTDFDKYAENLVTVNTKLETLIEKGAETVGDVDYADWMMYLRDMMVTVADDLESQLEIGDKVTGMNCRRAAMYMNMALKAAQGL